jgi:hypothetical protein
VTRKKPELESILEDRRKILKAVGGTALAVSLSGLAACSGGDSGSDPAPAASSAPAPEPAPEPTPEPAAAEAAPPAETAREATAAPADSGQMTRLDESDPQAQSLGYVNDAGSIDTAAQPRYQSGQACANCALYMGGEGQEYGPCSIFPGRLVNSGGWCTVYAPKPGA